MSYLSSFGDSDYWTCGYCQGQNHEESDVCSHCGE